MKVHIYPMAGDGIDNISTSPEPIELAEVGQHLEDWLRIRIRQGFYSNARQQRIPIAELQFKLAFADGGGADETLRPGTPFPQNREPEDTGRTEDSERRRWFGNDERMEAVPA